MCIVALIIMFFILCSDSSVTNTYNTEARKKAIKNGLPYYIDKKGYMCAVASNERCIYMTIFDKTWKHGPAKKELRGIHTNNLYHTIDIKEKTENEISEKKRLDNLQLEKYGKKYRYVRTQQWDTKDRLSYSKIDMVTGKLIDSINYEKVNGKYRYVLYYKDPRSSFDHHKIWNEDEKNFDCKVLTNEERYLYC